MSRLDLAVLFGSRMRARFVPLSVDRSFCISIFIGWSPPQSRFQGSIKMRATEFASSSASSGTKINASACAKETRSEDPPQRSG